MTRDPDKLKGGVVLLTFCVFGIGISLLVLPLGWNRANMEWRVTVVVIGLLSIFGLYKTVRMLADETTDEVESDKKKVSHHMDLDIRKIKKLIVAQVLLVCMLVGDFALLYFLLDPDTPDMPMCEVPMTLWIKYIAIIVLGLLLVCAMGKIDKEFDKLMPEETEETDDEVRFDEKKVSLYMELLKSFSRNAIQISLVGNGNVPLPAGCSKYGGRPDVADNFQWPHDNSGRPLSLLLQIDCADLAFLDREGLLPSSGQLYFFYELCEMKRDGNKNNVRVIYNDKPSSQLHPLDYPVNLGKEYQLQECRLQFSQRTSFPGLKEVGHLTHKPFKTKFNFEFEEASDRLEDEYWTGSEGIGNMLGYVFLIQKPIVKDLSNHVLLLQLESSEYWQEDDKTPHDLVFGDGGIIYFYIKREDLRARRFDSIIFARQCF